MLYVLQCSMEPTSAGWFGGRTTEHHAISPDMAAFVPHFGLNHATSCQRKQQERTRNPRTNHSFVTVAAVSLRTPHAAAWWLTVDPTFESLLALVRPLSSESWRSRRTASRKLGVLWLNLQPHRRASVPRHPYVVTS